MYFDPLVVQEIVKYLYNSNYLSVRKVWHTPDILMDDSLEAAIFLAKHEFNSHIVSRKHANNVEIIKIQPIIGYYLAWNTGLRNPEHERVIMQHPLILMNYMRKIVKDVWPEAEHMIAKYVEISLYYAKYILEGTFPQCEDLMCKSAENAYRYAKCINNGPWSKGEPIIATDAYFALQYITNVTGLPFPAAEDIIGPIYKSLFCSNNNLSNKDHCSVIKYNYVGCDAPYKYINFYKRKMDLMPSDVISIDYKKVRINSIYGDIIYLTDLSFIKFMSYENNYAYLQHRCYHYRIFEYA